MIGLNVFDYGQWLKSQGIKATGYVLSNRSVQFKGIDHTYFVERLRYNVERLLHRNIKDTPIRALASALLIGNKNELTAEDKQIFRQTGTSHLIAISGLHIGLIALFAFMLFRVLWSFSPRACQLIPAQKIGMIAAIMAAFIYSLMAVYLGICITTAKPCPTSKIVILACKFFGQGGAWNNGKMKIQANSRVGHFTGNMSSIIPAIAIIVVHSEI